MTFIGGVPQRRRRQRVERPESGAVGYGRCPTCGADEGIACQDMRHNQRCMKSRPHFDRPRLDVPASVASNQKRGCDE